MSDSVRMAIHFFVNFDIFKWLYLAYYWVYLRQTWGFCKNLVCTLRLCGSIVANPILYRLVPSPSRFENRQWPKRKKETGFVNNQLNSVHKTVWDNKLRLSSCLFLTRHWPLFPDAFMGGLCHDTRR